MSDLLIKLLKKAKVLAFQYMKTGKMQEILNFINMNSKNNYLRRDKF